MEGFTVSNANRFLNSGVTSGDSQSLSINNGSGVAGLDSSSGPQKSFADTLKDAIGNVNELQKSADKSMQNLATGRTDNVADVMIATERAEIALKLMIQVRNKIIDAYQDVMKMQV